MEIKEILKNCTVEGNIVKLPEIKLERDMYLNVKKQLELIGGKWKGGKVQGFVFPGNPSGLLFQIANGEKRNLKKEYQFFETPDCLADRLVELAGIKDNDSVLEPSAGRGAIVKAIHRKFPGRQISGYELMDINHHFLDKLSNFKLLGSNFLTECHQAFDVIVANPPFSNNQDIDHIQMMFEHLNSGGRLVSVSSAHWQLTEGRKEKAFKKWLSTIGADIYNLDRGTFKESGTMYPTCIIVILK